MIELARHIEILLLQNDCVIVPQLGGFMTHHVEAHYDDEDRLFLPPLRTLGFNPQLRMNDSLLAQSYVEAYDLSYPEALRRIESEVDELKQQLSDEGSYELTDIGTLSVNADGNYQFEPCEAGILTPTLYGLSSFEFPKLHDKAFVAKEPASEAKTEAAEENEKVQDVQPALIDFTDDEDDNRAITIRMSWIRNAVAVAAAVVLFFLMATPVANSDLSSASMSQLQGSALTRLMPKDTNAVPAAQPLAPERADSSKAVEQPAEVSEQPAEVPAQYFIVLASQVAKHNAENFVKELQEKGYKDARIYINNNIVRVVYGHYASETDAYNELRTVRHNKYFEEAWVLKGKG